MGIFGKSVDAVGNAAEKIGEAFDKNFTSKEEKMQLDNEDRASAREMQKTALTQDDKFTKRAVFYLAYYWSLIAGFFILIILVIEVPENNIRLVDTITGFLLGTIIGAIINFLYGSSNGSQAKTAQTDGLIKSLFNKK